MSVGTKIRLNPPMKKYWKKIVALVIVIAVVIGFGFAFQAGVFGDLFQGRIGKSPSVNRARPASGSLSIHISKDSCRALYDKATACFLDPNSNLADCQYLQLLYATYCKK